MFGAVAKAVKLGMQSIPLLSIPMEVLSASQLKVIPGIDPIKHKFDKSVAEQIVVSIGFTSVIG
jgi:hypothetical protein